MEGRPERDKANEVERSDRLGSLDISGEIEVVVHESLPNPAIEP